MVITNLLIKKNEIKLVLYNNKNDTIDGINIIN